MLRLIAGMLACGSCLELAVYAADAATEQFEQQTLQRYAERAVRASQSDRQRWLREMQTAFAGRAIVPQRLEDFDQWFELLRGEQADWHRTSCPTPQLAELYEQVARRLELGPVPAIRRDEFLHYVRRVLWRQEDHDQLPDIDAEADKVFRVLDQNGDGVLESEEMTAALRQARASADTDGNGRIDRQEYRRYFMHRALALTDQLAASKAPEGKGGPSQPAKDAVPLPPWFRELDTDGDGQISIREWLTSGRPLEEFQSYDLDGDFLLTPMEYLRFQRQQQPSSDGLPLPLTSGIKKKEERPYYK